MNNLFQNDIERIFHNALDLPAEQRTVYLERECAANHSLREEVESILKSYENDADFLSKPIFEVGMEAIAAQRKTSLENTEIGFYKIYEKIGEGGMGEVYRADDLRLNRRIALKFLTDSLANNQNAKRQLQREARAAAALEHPNICAVHGIEEIGEHNFIVMQFIEGITLAEHIEKSGKIKAEEFKFLAEQILSAMAFAHSHNIIHRDLKPGNIMLNGGGQIKILDFGLAKITQNDKWLNNETNFSHNGLIIGTVAYMSPEQLRSEKADFASDIFSIGIIFYELLTGKNPFSRKSQAETIAAVLGEKVTPMRELAPELPENLCRLVEKCLEKNAAERFQSVAEILVELDNAESENYRAVSAKNRSRFFIKAALAVVLILIFFASGMFLYKSRYSQRTIAVLPIKFENLLPEKEYLAEDLTQSIIGKLSNLSDLKVKNQMLVAQYNVKDTDPREAGKQLNVDAVFAGIIKQRAEGMFLEGKIIRISDGVLLDPLYEIPFDETNLIGLPENIASRIITKVETKLTEADRNKLAKKDTESVQAKNFYLEGRFYLKRRKDGEAVQKAIEAFTAAKDIDQKYAKAFAGLADAFIASSSPGTKNARTPEVAFRLAKDAANKAVELDNTLAEAYNSLGLISARYDFNWRDAENYFRMAINLDPEFLPARSELIRVFSQQARYDEAVEEANKLKEIDPFSISSALQIAVVYYKKRDYQQMEKIFSELVQNYPNEMRIKYTRTYLLLKTNRFEEAAGIMEGFYQTEKIQDKVLAAAPLGFAYAKMGRRNDALKIINDLESMNTKDNFVPAQEKALIYVALGEYDKAFENIRLSCNERNQSLPNWITDPIVDEIRNDARFEEIKKCVNL